MSEPCACPPDRPPTDIERIAQHFDERFRDWQPVCPASTDMLFGWVRDEGLAGASVLDIGCGTGELIVRTLEAGSTRATGADLSSEAIAQASALVREKGLADRVELWIGDAAVEPLGEHDVVLLDKVICCYPDADTLIARSTAAARRLYAITIPESRGVWGLIARARWYIFDLVERLRGADHPRFVHERSEVEAKVLAAGFRPIHTGRQFVWFVGVYARR
ncbi:MAG: SAM-dependent methyltransferase [Candidatus Limnocylindria bacterium]